MDIIKRFFRWLRRNLHGFSEQPGATDFILRQALREMEKELEQKAAKIAGAFAGTVTQMPAACTQLMLAVDFVSGPSYEIVIVGDTQGQDTKQLLAAINRPFIPNKIVLLRPGGEVSPEIDTFAPFTKHYSATDGKATAYVCRNYNCQLPTTDINTTLALLNPG